MSTARKFRRAHSVPQTNDERPLLRWARAVNWLFAHLGPGRQRLLIRAKFSLARYWTNPAVPPEKLGLAGKFEYRPALIQLAFRLYADGDVDFVNRWGRDERVTDPHLVGLVHREYNRLVGEGRRQARIS